MSSQTLSSLVVDLKLETAQLRKGVDQAAAQIDKLTKAFGAIAGAVVLKELGGMALDAASKLGEFVMRGAEAADKMGKLAQSVGVPVEALSRLDYAAGMSGVSTEQLGVALNKLNKNLAEAGAGGKHQTAMFEALGVAVKDTGGNVRSTEAVFADLADVFADMPDDASKSALAMEVFGKAGADLIPLLNEGKDGLAEMSDEADRLGVTIDAKAAKAAESFNDSIDKMHRALNGVATQAIAKVGPEFAKLADEFVNSKEFANLLESSVKGLTVTLKVLASACIIVAAQVQTLQTKLIYLDGIIQSLKKGDLEEAMKRSAYGMQAVEGITFRMNKRLDELWEDSAKKSEESAERTAKAHEKSGARILKAIKDQEQAIKDQEKAAKELADFLKDTLAAKLDLDAAMSKNSIDLANKKGSIDAGAAGQRESFANIGVSVADQLARATSGFKDFNQALDMSVAFAKAREEKLTEAKNLEMMHAFDAAAAATAVAQFYDEQAKQAQGAADAYRQIKENLQRDVNTVSGAFAALGQSVLQAIPRLNELVSAAQQGAQLGGVWGALIAVFVQLLSETQGFQQIIDHVNASLDKVLSALEPLVAGLAAVFDATSSVTDAFMSTLKGPLETIGGLLESIAPILKAFDDVLKVVSDGLNGAMQGMELFAKPIFMILKLIGIVLKVIAPILEIIMIPLTLIGELFEWLAEILDPVFKEIDKAFSWLANRLDEFGDFIGTLGERISNWIKGKGFKSDAELAPSTAESRAYTDPNEGLISEEVRPVGDAAKGAADSLKNLGDTADKVTDQLTNVPSGYKVATQRFLATVAETISSTFSIEKIAIGVNTYNKRQNFASSGSAFGNYFGGGG